MAIRHGVYGFLVQNGSVLMVKTKSGSLAIWNFPGGGIEPGEEPLQALTRECIEEIGATVIVHECLYEPKELFIHPALGSENKMTYYRISLADDSQVDYQLNGARWFAFDSLPFEEMLSVDQKAAMLLQL